jgi:hypothetical protein
MSLPEGPIPSLDLRAFYAVELHRPTRAVLDVLVEGIDVVPSEEGDPTAGGFSRWCDDEDTARSAFTFGPWTSPRTLPGRKARDAWRLAVERGLVPTSWRDDARRCFADQTLRFFCDACNGLGATGWNYDDTCAACHGRGSEMERGRVSRPTSLADVAWMVSHPGLVERAEGLARDAVSRLGAAGPGTERIQWGRLRVGRPHGLIPLVLVSPVSTLAQPRPSGWDAERMKGRAFVRAPWWSAASQLLDATRELLCVDVGVAWHHRAAGITDSPMEPVLRLWELGVVIEELTPDAIVLERATRRSMRSWRGGVSFG